MAITVTKEEFVSLKDIKFEINKEYDKEKDVVLVSIDIGNKSEKKIFLSFGSKIKDKEGFITNSKNDVEIEKTIQMENKYDGAFGKNQPILAYVNQKNKYPSHNQMEFLEWMFESNIGQIIKYFDLNPFLGVDCIVLNNNEKQKSFSIFFDMKKSNIYFFDIYIYSISQKVTTPDPKVMATGFFMSSFIKWLTGGREESIDPAFCEYSVKQINLFKIKGSIEKNSTGEINLLYSIEEVQKPPVDGNN